MSKRQISLRFIRYYPWFWWGRGTEPGRFMSDGPMLIDTDLVRGWTSCADVLRPMSRMVTSQLSGPISQERAAEIWANLTSGPLTECTLVGAHLYYPNVIAILECPDGKRLAASASHIEWVMHVLETDHELWMSQNGVIVLTIGGSPAVCLARRMNKDLRDGDIPAFSDDQQDWVRPESVPARAAACESEVG